MSTVIAYSTPEFAVLGTDTYTRTHSGIECFDAEKLHRWPHGWLAGAGLSLPIEVLRDFLRQAPIEQGADVQDAMDTARRLCMAQMAHIGDRIGSTSVAVTYSGQIFVLAPVSGIDRAGVYTADGAMGFMPDDGTPELFYAAVKRFGRPSDELEAVKQAARFVAEVSLFSNEVSGTVDVAVGDRRFRGECMDVADDPEAFEV